MVTPLAQEIYNSFLNDLKNLAKLKKTNYDNALRIICQDNLQEMTKQGWNEKEAKIVLQQEVDAGNTNLHV